MSDFGSPTSTSSVVPFKQLHVVAAIISHSGKILAAKRLEGGPSSLKWEFPGGKVENDEVPEMALIREIREELGMDITIESEMGTFSTPIAGYLIDLHCFHCATADPNVDLRAHSHALWCDHAQLRALDWALPDLPVVAAILRADLESNTS